jgi:predicted nucleic-acid-binding Zn-ribbon protein
MDDPLTAFSCPKCGAISIKPRLRWERLPAVNKVEQRPREHILIFCDDCGYSEKRSTKDQP